MKTDAKTTELAAKRDQELGVAKSDRNVRKTISAGVCIRIQMGLWRKAKLTHKTERSEEIYVFQVLNVLFVGLEARVQ
jgi:hypothetical protein